MHRGPKEGAQDLIYAKVSSLLPVATEALTIATKLSFGADGVSTAVSYLSFTACSYLMNLRSKKFARNGIQEKGILDMMTTQGKYLEVWAIRKYTGETFAFDMDSFLDVYRMIPSRVHILLLDGLGKRILLLHDKYVKVCISGKLGFSDEYGFTLKEEIKTGPINTILLERNAGPLSNTFSYKEGSAPGEIIRKSFVMDLAYVPAH